MKPGRPPLEPRIAALEAKIAELGKATLELNERLTALEGSGDKITKPETYEPRFTQWPPNGR